MVRELPPSGLVYCPFHKTWEGIVDDPDGKLCEWCCQVRPCGMDHEGKEEEVEETPAREKRGLDDEVFEFVDLTNETPVD